MNLKKFFALVFISNFIIFWGMYELGWFGVRDTFEDALQADSLATLQDPLNTEYKISYGQRVNEVQFVDGSSLWYADVDRNITETSSILSDPVYGDVDGDGDLDAAVLIVHTSQGSGTFYHAALAVNDNEQYIGTDTVFLGDRIQPVSVTVEDRRAKFKYLDRKSSDSFVDEPSVERELHLIFDPITLQLIQVEVDFEGEADPNVMTLDMNEWRWIKTEYNNDTTVTPKQPDVFGVTFSRDGNMRASTDCNHLQASYTADDSWIEFGPITMTKMHCEGSQDSDFAAMLGEVHYYSFTSSGELVMFLRFDNGSITFR